AFQGWQRLGGKDWNAFLGQAEAEVMTVKAYHQLPLWNPWRKGGQVSFAQPESMLLSPVTPLALLFGVPAAFKLLVLPLFVFGCAGMWTLAGYFGLSGWPRMTPGLVFFGSSVFPLYLSGGLPNWLCAVALLPWLIWLYARGLDDHRFLLGAAAAYAAFIFCGAIYQFVLIPVFLGFHAACLALARRSGRPLLGLAAVIAGGGALAALRLVPIAEVYLAFPRELAARGPSPWDLLHDLPILHSMQGPERLVSFVIFCLSLAAGFGLQAVDERVALVVPPSLRFAAGAGITLLLAASLALVNAPISATAFPVDPPVGLHPGPFHQSRLPSHPEQW